MKEYIFPSCSLCRNLRIGLGLAALVAIGFYVVLLASMNGRNGNGNV